MTTHICCPPELDNMTKFLKIPYTFDLEYGEIRVVINCNVYLCWLEFITWKATGEEKKPSISPNYEYQKLQ